MIKIIKIQIYLHKENMFIITKLKLILIIILIILMKIIIVNVNYY